MSVDLKKTNQSERDAAFEALWVATVGGFAQMHPTAAVPAVVLPVAKQLAQTAHRNGCELGRLQTLRALTPSLN